ncbi:hypothetical protein CEXT_506251 [Caerostris extrusa]|uniref:Uncharacterized protein n=1 Tax=Caerostris extrusa TaxID=172846 RepID=A0AAV4XCF5_CAEEX|nr:hypothetical protein CEXT_506251 [Caerostris extrusa]
MNELYYNHKAELATQNQLKTSQINVAFDKYNTNVILSSQHDLIHIPQLDGMFDIESGSNPVKQGTVKLNPKSCGKRIKRTSLQENERFKHDLKNYYGERNDFRNNTASSLTSLQTENNALLKSKELQRKFKFRL